MFLTIAYFVFVLQIATILPLILSLPIKIRRSLTEMFTYFVKNVYVRYLFIVIGMILLFLFAENLLAVWRYSQLKTELSDAVGIGVTSGKHEILMKLIRAQRNMYLTFFVNFNMIVLYGLKSLIVRLCDYENNPMDGRISADKITNVIEKMESVKGLEKVGNILNSEQKPNVEWESS